MKTIILATNNTHKQKEFQELLSGIKILTLKDVGFTGDVEETGSTTKENAEIKAKAIFEFEKSKGLNYPVISDDSGLFVNSLGGEPGVYSARYGGDHNSQSNRDKVLKNLSKMTDRSAYFECTICYIDENTTKFFVGRTYGIITKEEIGDTSFGYDCIFLSDDLHKTFGQSTEEEKDSVSHRGRAVTELKKFLSK